MEEQLAGGNMDPVVRVGDTVRRISGPWTPAVHGLLHRCELAGIPETPRALGADEGGREILSYLPGDVLAGTAPDIQWSRGILTAAAALLRRIHDASTPLAAAGLEWRQPTHHPAEVVCHNDFAPYNLLVREGVLAGVIDFDMASPGPRVWDLAYLAYRLVPYAEDAPGFDEARFGSRAERLHTLIDAYGQTLEPRHVLAVAADRLDELAVFTDGRLAETGRADFADHAAMYRRDAERLRRLASARPGQTASATD